MSDKIDNEVQENEGTEREGVGIQHQTSDAPGSGDVAETIAKLQTRIDELEHERQKVTAESIERRKKLKDTRTENETLMERLDALERESRENKLAATVNEAIATHGLPVEARELLGSDPDAVADRAKALAEMISSGVKSAAPKGGAKSPERKPSGGRNPSAAAEPNLNDLIAQYS